MAAPGDERAVGVNQNSPPQRFPPQKHTEPHGIPISQGQFDRPGGTVERNLHLDDVTKFTMTARTGHQTLIQNRRNTGNRWLAAVLLGMNDKRNMRSAPVGNNLNIGSVQG